MEPFKECCKRCWQLWDGNSSRLQQTHRKINQQTKRFWRGTETQRVHPRLALGQQLPNWSAIRCKILSLRLSFLSFVTLEVVWCRETQIMSWSPFVIVVVGGIEGGVKAVSHNYRDRMICLFPVWKFPKTNLYANGVGFSYCDTRILCENVHGQISSLRCFTEIKPIWCEKSWLNI